MTKKKKCKSRARSLANLRPGGNLKHGAFLFLRTGKIPPEHADVAAEAQRLGKRLREKYCALGNFVLNTVQSVPIRQLVTEDVFSELLIRHLWAQVAQADSDEKLEQALTLPGWMTWLAASNRIRRLFRQLERNLRDFR